MQYILSYMQRSTLVLTALTILFGAQSIRVLLPSLTWYWGATLGLTTGQLVIATYAPVTLAWLAPLLGQWLGLGRTMRAFGMGLLLCRVVEQFSTTPAVDVWLALGASACFMGLLPLLYSRALSAGEAGLPSLAPGILLGLGVDTALRGLTGTLDLSWIPGPWPRLVTIGLVAVFAYALRRVTSTPASLQGEGFLASLPLIGLGPLLFVELHILQNQGWVATLTGWPPALALIWIMLGNVGALLAASFALTHERPRSRWWPLLPAGALILGLLVVEVPGWIFAVGALVVLVSAGSLLAIIVGAVRPPAPRAGAAPLSFAFGLGLLIFVGLGVLYYVSFLVPLLPFPRSTLAPLAGAGLAVCALGAGWQHRHSRASRLHVWTPARLGALLLLAPAALWMADVTAPPPARPASGSVRIMTYNIRAAFGLSGTLDVEAVAQVIEDSGAEVVVLQELSRGWLISGTADLLTLFSRRLKMPAAVMGPVTDPVGGNAIVSRHPIPAGGHGVLPHLDALVGRGYVWAQLDWGAGEPLLIMGTHLDSERADVRIAQLTALLAEWAGRPRTVLVGDMNARPGSEEIGMILAAGFVDAWFETGQPERSRIDWIFHTPDLVARDVVVIESPASDHPAFAATIGPRR